MDLMRGREQSGDLKQCMASTPAGRADETEREQDPMTTAATRRSITIDHVVIASNQPYEKVLEGLQSQMGSEEGWRQTEQRIQDLVAAQASLEQVEETIERQLGTSDFTIFKTAEHTPLHLLAGKTSRAIQYMAGNPLLANQM